MTHICVGKLTILGSDNGLSPGRRQAIIWTNAGILSIGPLGTNFSEILIGIQTFSFKEMRLKMSSAKWRPFCLGLNVLTHWGLVMQVNWITVALDNGLLPIRCWAIIQTNGERINNNTHFKIYLWNFSWNFDVFFYRDHSGNGLERDSSATNYLHLRDAS